MTNLVTFCTENLINQILENSGSLIDMYKTPDSGNGSGFLEWLFEDSEICILMFWDNWTKYEKLSNISLAWLTELRNSIEGPVDILVLPLFVLKQTDVMESGFQIIDINGVKYLCNLDGSTVAPCGALPYDTIVPEFVKLIKTFRN